MATSALQTYSSFFQCLFDQPDRPGDRFYGAFSVFRAIDSRDVEQRPTHLPHIHDFAVIWDDDHDTRIIAVIEEMLMAGLLPGVQFIGEHKGSLTVILAARTYWKIDVEAYTKRVEALTGAVGDFWNVRLGMYDHGKGNLRIGHQCDFQEILGLDGEAEHAFLYTIDSMWNLGTKEWTCADVPEVPLPPGQFFAPRNRYKMRRSQLR
ncbi:hypothetical protein ASG87_01420 [Frateuria sp. Soil773]|uniref:hypothetical protein n=1 Tax=Frateuria sp. Soil773 TaxID=1736407 RepID=UPI0006FF81C5|nr:hypothetical protein [Frateuria sp. Soil773]KRE90823.1 hypothetical protein ASG87_01420 [Frateuria sp. Soil773]